MLDPAGPPPIIPTSKSGTDEFISAVFSPRCMFGIRSFCRIDLLAQPDCERRSRLPTRLNTNKSPNACGGGCKNIKRFQRGNATFTVALWSPIKPKFDPFAKHEKTCTSTVIIGKTSCTYCASRQPRKRLFPKECVNQLSLSLRNVQAFV